MMFVKRFCFIFPRLWSVETVKYKRHFNLNDWVEMKWSCHQQQWVISVSRSDHSSSETTLDLLWLTNIWLQLWHCDTMCDQRPIIAGQIIITKCQHNLLLTTDASLHWSTTDFYFEKNFWKIQFQGTFDKIYFNVPMGIQTTQTLKLKKRFC